MSISAFFAHLGAPLKTRYSWGAVSPTGTVYLRVWQHEVRTINGVRCYRLTNHKHYRQQSRKNPNYEERKQHVQFIRQRAPVFCVVCRARNSSAIPLRYHSHATPPIKGVQLVTYGGDDWLEV